MAPSRLPTQEAWRASQVGLAEEPPLVSEVLFRFPASLGAERNGYGQQIHAHADGAAVRRFEVRQINPFLRWVLSLGGEAEILGPRSCGASWRSWRRRWLRSTAQARWLNG